jgi:hypothetical protein
VNGVGAVRGTVMDSTRMAGLRDARVFLDGTQFSARSEAGGAFAITDVPPGTYSLSVAHPRFDSLQSRAPSATVTLTPGEETVANLSGPSLATILERDCTAYERTSGVMLRGNVVDGQTGAPAPDALVTVTWSRLAVAGESVSGVSERQSATRTDSAGRYAVCGLPTEIRVTARASFDGRRSDAASLVLAPSDIAIRDIAIGSTSVVAAAEAPKARARSTATANAAPPRNRVMQEVDRRLRRGNGSFLTRTQIDRSNAARLTDLLRRMPSVTLLPNDNGSIMVELRGAKKISFTSTTVRTDSGSSTARLPAPARGTTDMTVKNCPAGFLLDGLAIDAGAAVDLEMQPDMLEAIEVYTPAQVPIEYSSRFSECGVVMIWTRHFAERPDPQPGAAGDR